MTKQQTNDRGSEHFMVRKTVNSFGVQVVALTIVIDFAMVAIISTLGTGSSMWWIVIPVALVCAGGGMVIRGVQYLMLESDTMAVDDTPDADPVRRHGELTAADQPAHAR
jgi:hypothetical protein